jgi:hypothetical protein
MVMLVGLSGCTAFGSEASGEVPAGQRPLSGVWMCGPEPSQQQRESAASWAEWYREQAARSPRFSEILQDAGNPPLDGVTAAMLNAITADLRSRSTRGGDPNKTFCIGAAVRVSEWVASGTLHLMSTLVAGVNECANVFDALYREMPFCRRDDALLFMMLTNQFADRVYRLTPYIQGPYYANPRFALDQRLWRDVACAPSLQPGS